MISKPLDFPPFITSHDKRVITVLKRKSNRERQFSTTHTPKQPQRIPHSHLSSTSHQSSPPLPPAYSPLPLLPTRFPSTSSPPSTPRLALLTFFCFFFSLSLFPSRSLSQLSPLSIFTYLSLLCVFTPHFKLFSLLFFLVLSNKAPHIHPSIHHSVNY